MTFHKMIAPFAAAGLALATPAIGQSASALSSVQAHLKASDTMTADFVQTDRNGQRLSGKLTLKRPGKIRFQYQKGVPMLIVGDGSRVEELAHVRVPFLVIHGRADPLVPVEGGIDTAKSVPGAKLELIEGMGHDLPVPLCETYVRLIADHARAATAGAQAAD